ncbi:MAG: MFS transporter, partial [Alphaproteobacteria bacterium]
MRQAIDAAGPVLIAALLLVFGHGLLATLTSIQLANSDNATLLAGIAASAFFGGQMAGAIYGQRTLRSVGHIRAFSAFAALAAVVALLQPLLGIGWNWVLLRFLFGFGVVVMFLAMESWLNATVRNEARGSVFSMYMAIVYGGMAIGQGPIAILDMTASIGFTIAAICVMLASVPMSLTARAQPALDDDDPLSLRRI